MCKNHVCKSCASGVMYPGKMMFVDSLWADWKIYLTRVGIKPETFGMLAHNLVPKEQGWLAQCYPN